MEQHAVPQNISSYQFRLIGDMTVKQFVELAGGVLLAWLVISSKIPFVLKWPVGIFLGFFGFALAFLPVQERPLDIWIKNFILGIYRPTLYLWKKPPYIPIPVKHKKQAPAIDPAQLKTQAEKLQAYLQSMNQPKDSFLDGKDTQKLEKISQLINSYSPQAVKTIKPMNDKTVFSNGSKPIKTGGVRVRKLASKSDIAGQKLVYAKKPDDFAQKAVKEPVLALFENPPVSDIPTAPPLVSPAPPLTPPLKVRSLFSEKKRTRAQYSKGIQIPIAPDRPNLLAGIVLDPWQKPIPGTVIEIKNKSEETMLVAKTNKLGQFYTATPLENGTYFLAPEHADWNFDIIEMEFKGNVISPLKIIGTK